MRRLVFVSDEVGFNHLCYMESDKTEEESTMDFRKEKEREERGGEEEGGGEGGGGGEEGEKGEGGKEEKEEEKYLEKRNTLRRASMLARFSGLRLTHILRNSLKSFVHWGLVNSGHPFFVIFNSA